MEPTTTANSPRRTLSTAEQRRGELVEAAVGVFARRGYSAPTTEIAKVAGISQAYLFRLFPTKEELFAEAAGVGTKRMLAAFKEAAAQGRRDGIEPLEAMGTAYFELVDRDRDVLLIQLHSQVAAAEAPLVRKAMQNCFAELWALVKKESGATDEELQAWFAYGMLCNVMAAIDADGLDAEWAKALTKSDKKDAAKKG